MDCHVEKKTEKFLNAIGEPAALELLAEECAELAHAALKLARLERGENPTPALPKECQEKIFEEIADVLISMEVVEQCQWFNGKKTKHYYEAHMRRFAERAGIRKPL